MSTAVSIATSPTDLASLAAQFALLADPLRLLIVESLAREQLCTCHLIDLTGAKQTTISHHLRLLREAGVVLPEAEGRFTWYRLAPGAFADGLKRLQGITLAAESTARLRPACAPAAVLAHEENDIAGVAATGLAPSAVGRAYLAAVADANATAAALAD